METLIEKLSGLPEEKQDEYAATYLSLLEDDQRWDELFARTTDEQWRKIAEEARKEVERGESMPLDDFINQK